MDDDTGRSKSDIYLWMVIIGSMISIWVTFFIWIIYPDLAKGFIFAMFATWIVIFFFWGGHNIVEFEKNQEEIKGDD